MATGTVITATCHFLIRTPRATSDATSRPTPVADCRGMQFVHNYYHPVIRLMSRHQSVYESPYGHSTGVMDAKCRLLFLIKCRTPVPSSSRLPLSLRSCCSYHNFLFIEWLALSEHEYAEEQQPRKDRTGDGMGSIINLTLCDIIVICLVIIINIIFVPSVESLSIDHWGHG